MAGFPGKEAGPPGGWRKCQEDESPENERHENFYAEIDDFAPSVLTPTGSDSGAGEEDDDGLYHDIFASRRVGRPPFLEIQPWIPPEVCVPSPRTTWQNFTVSPRLERRQVSERTLGVTPSCSLLRAGSN